MRQMTEIGGMDALNVSLPDTAEERDAVADLLEYNFRRREVAEAELDAAKQELRRLLLRGQTAGMRVTAMAAAAQISRDTAHRILREALEGEELAQQRTKKEADSMSWDDKRQWAKGIVARVPRGDLEQNEFKAFVNMLLLKALGSNPEDVPRSVEGVLNDAAETMRTVAGKPDFEPQFDRALLSEPWPQSP